MCSAAWGGGEVLVEDRGVCSAAWGGGEVLVDDRGVCCAAWGGGEVPLSATTVCAGGCHPHSGMLGLLPCHKAVSCCLPTGLPTSTAAPTLTPPPHPPGASGAASHSVSLLGISEALSAIVNRYGSCRARRVVLSPFPHQQGGVPSSSAAGGPAGGASSEQGQGQGRCPEGDGASGSEGLVVLVGCAVSREDVPAAIGRCFTHTLQVRPYYFVGGGLPLCTCRHWRPLHPHVLWGGMPQRHLRGG